MKKVLLFLAGLAIGIFLFLPKTNLYYLLQNNLKKQSIYIISHTESYITKFSLKNGEIIYKNMKIARFKRIDFYIFLFYNKIEINKLKLNIGNYQINRALIVYSLLHPFKAEINADTNFAEIKGYADLKNSSIKLYFYKIKNLSIKKFLRKDKKGYYYYVKY